MTFNPFPIRQTERLNLRQTIHSDAAELLFLRSDAVVNKYVTRPAPKNKKEVREFIDMINDGISNGTNLYWAIALKDSPTMIGSICLWKFSADRKTAEVGYDLNPEFYRCGIMTEAMKCVLGFGFGELQLEKIEAYTHSKNEGSKRLLLKHGFVLVEGKTDKLNPYNVVFEVTKPRQQAG